MRPQTNGQAKSANKLVLKGIKTSLEAAKEALVDDLSGVLLFARTITKEATGHSLFGLVCGSKAMIPLEVGIPSHWMTFYKFEKNEEEKPINMD